MPVKGGVCVTHGAKVKRCSFEGCTNIVVKGGVCVASHMEQNRKQRSDAIMKVVPMEPLREGFVGRMALRGS